MCCVEFLNVDTPRFNVLGVGVHAVNLETATRNLISASREGKSGYVCCCDAHSIIQARHHPQHRRTLNHALMATPDGMPLVWTGRRSGFLDVGRTYGPDLMEAMCAETADTELTHYFYGGRDETAEKLVEQLQQRFPNLRVAGHETPPWHNDVAKLPTEGIKQTAADFVWIGLSTPKQEAFMQHFHQQDSPKCITLGVGAAFDFLSGQVQQAPKRWQRAGFEWLWRLGQEPRRLTKRYVVTVPSFAIRLLAQRMGWAKFPLD
jgi:N-acetylglucosaminyldiphosphoundecaprenol N-acetyl-beta-D-mannosaminyltransferase